jgi:ABC-type antimicrobial peptide transport system permease subunit
LRWPRWRLLALVSAALGLLAAAPLPKLFAATLQGFRVHGLAIFICVPLLLLLVVLAAIYVPASRAARIDPMEALRYE